MKPFLVILPFHRGDWQLAFDLLDWIQELGGAEEYPLLLLSSSNTLNVELLRMTERARHIFGQVYSVRCTAPDQAWPMGPNLMFREACRLVRTRYPLPFLWLEPDCVPLKPGWLDSISDEYLACKKPFLGHLQHQTANPALPADYMPGCSVYPPNAENLLCNHWAPVEQAWDVTTALATVPLAMRSQSLFEFWGRKNLPPTFKMERTADDPENVLTPTQIPPHAVLFHRCKDGSLIRLLYRMSGIAQKQKLGQLSLIAHLDGQSGYGTFSVQVAMELIARGYDLKIHSPFWHDNLGKVPVTVKRRFCHPDKLGIRKLVIYPCVVQPAALSPSGDVAYLTMWESTRLVSMLHAHMRGAVATMNRCRVVIVPGAWNATLFSANGVNVPIRVAPLAVDTALFQPLLNDPFKVLTFGTAAKTTSGGIRKGFEIVVDAFLAAFPKEQDVALRVKMFADDPDINRFGDSRIQVIRNYLSLEQLKAWYAGINVFASGSASEGWGRHQQEAMCMGRPVIGINFGGVTEFFNEVNGYPSDWTLVPAQGIYETMGHYARPSVDSMAAQMRRCYTNRQEIISKSKLAAESAHRFTIRNSVDKILEILREVKLLE